MILLQRKQCDDHINISEHFMTVDMWLGTNIPKSLSQNVTSQLITRQAARVNFLWLVHECNCLNFFFFFFPPEVILCSCVPHCVCCSLITPDCHLSPHCCWNNLATALEKKKKKLKKKKGHSAIRTSHIFLRWRLSLFCVFFWVSALAVKSYF